MATSVQALTITPAAGTISPNATQFQAYTSTTTLTAGGTPVTPPYTWSATGLPAGLSLSTSGANNQICTITGTPTVSGTFNAITITVADSKTPTKRTASGTYSLTINPYCRFSGGNSGAIAFGSAGLIDPSTPGSLIKANVTGQVNFQCGAGLNYTVAVTSPSLPLTMTGANTIPFTLGIASGTSSSDSALIPLLGPSATPLIPDSTISNYENFVAGSSSIGAITVTISWGGGAPGSLIATVNVASTTVSDTCGNLTPGSIAFSVDPAAPGPMTPNTTSNGTAPTVMCTAGRSHSVSCSSASYQLRKGGADPIAYTITDCTPSPVVGSGFLTAKPISIGLSLSAGGVNGYQNAEAGIHSDIVTVTITY